MALEILINKKCKFKEENSEEFIMNLMKKSFAVDILPQYIATQADCSIEDAIKIPISFEAFGMDNISILDLKHEIENSMIWSKDCNNCNANISKRNFGCYNRISYPISEEFEETLVKNYPEKGTIAYELFLHAVKDFTEASNTSIDFRKSGYLESKIEKSVKIKDSFLKSETFSSNFLLGLILFSGSSLTPHHNKIILLFLGFFDKKLTMDELRDEEYIKSILSKKIHNHHFSNTNESDLINILIFSVIENISLSIDV